MNSANPAELCIGLTEPAFLASIVAGTTAALILGALVGELERPRVGPSLSRISRNLAWCGALAAVFLGPLFLLNALFSWAHPDLVLCTSVVGPYFFFPPVVLFVVGVIRGIREARLPPVGTGSVRTG